MPVAAPDALAWTYDSRPGVGRYRHGPSGRFVGSQQIKALRDNFLTARSTNARDLASQLASGDLSVSAWETAMREQIKLVHGVEFAFGRGGLDQMTATDWQTVGGLVADQWQYLNSFAGDIADGTLSEDAIGARSDLYVGAATEAYERGAASAEGMPELDQYPGDGQTQCLGRCRCSLLIEVNDDVGGGWLVTWQAEADACEDCAGMADDWSPLEVEPD